MPQESDASQTMELEFIQALSPLFAQLNRYVVHWDEIPGKGSKILTEFLAQELDIDPIENESVEKIDEFTIKVIISKKKFLLKLDERKSKLSLQIEDTKPEKKFIVEKRKNRLKITLKPLRSPLGAAAYYTFLIKMFPTNFNAIDKAAKVVMGRNMNSSKLEKGRQDLLELGFIARILPVFEENKKMVKKAVENNLNLSTLSENKENEISDNELSGRETYLPISPELIWQDNVDKLEGIIATRGIQQRSDLAKELQETYKKTFGNYGVRIEQGSITVFHSSQWLLYYLAYNIKENQSIRMLLGTLASFEEPYIKYYIKMLESKLKTKIICDPRAKGARERIKGILDLKSNYGENVDIRATKLTDATSRRMIYNNLSIDGKKLAGYHSDLSYVSTIYFQPNIINRMRENFDISFELSSKINCPPDMYNV
jgi:hypothetical protein